MILYADDQAPKRIEFPIRLGGVVGADVASVVVVVRKPGGTFVEWTLTPESPSPLTATHWNGYFPLASDGTSLGADGMFFCKAFLLDAGGAELGSTSETGFPVSPTRVRRPL
ncbi:MAG: hypothetical protein ACRCU1_03505 [Alsobacter sp.]